MIKTKQLANTPRTVCFIEKAKAIHGDKYNYSKVNYVNSRQKVIITCFKHGIFSQSPDQHLRGHGCADCGSYKKGNTASFIEKARKVHGDKYDYSIVNYVNSRQKVIIICSKHGEFSQSPNGHIQGRGCKYCGLRSSIDSIIVGRVKII